MLTYLCLECGKENKLKDLKIISVLEDGEFQYEEFVCSCGQNKHAIIKR